MQYARSEKESTSVYESETVFARLRRSRECKVNNGEKLRLNAETNEREDADFPLRN